MTLFCLAVVVTAAAQTGDSKKTKGTAKAKDSRAELDALIDKLGKTPPDWFQATKVNYPPSLDLSWPEKPEGGWNSQKNVGQFFTAPYDVYLDPSNAGIQPDLLFVSHERDFVIRENNGIVGAPDLVVEILSKGTMHKDRGDKREVYEQFAVREYWVVDPPNKSIEVYRMENNSYRLFSSAAEEGAVKSSVLPDFEVDMKAIFG